MEYEEFEIDGKKYALTKEFSEEEMGTFKDEEPKKEPSKEEVDIEKTHQIDIVYDPAVLDTTLTHIFGSDANE